jgi:hypothetical protein
VVNLCTVINPNWKHKVCSLGKDTKNTIPCQEKREFRKTVNHAMVLRILYLSVVEPCGFWLSIFSARLKHLLIKLSFLFVSSCTPSSTSPRSSSLLSIFVCLSFCRLDNIPHYLDILFADRISNLIKCDDIFDSTLEPRCIVCMFSGQLKGVLVSFRRKPLNVLRRIRS